VLFLHGPAGIGKSTLLKRFADDARDQGRPVVEIDGGAIDPSPAGFDAVAHTALTTERVVLMVDTFERCQGLEGWLRDRFLPRLSAGAVVVLAGQHRPDPRWTSDVAWSDLLHVTELGDLTRTEARELLRRRSVPEHLHDDVMAFAGGHPMALSLAAAVAGREGHAAGWTPAPDVLTALLTHLVGEVPSAAHRLALGVCAHAPTTTEELLRAVSGDQAAALFQWLRRLPFIESRPHGLAPHSVVRGVLDADFRWRDPQGYEDMHRRVTAHLLDRARTATGDATVPAIRALYGMISADPFFADADGDPGTGGFYADTITPADHRAVLELTEDTCAGPADKLVRFWLDRRPEAFTVFRRSSDATPVAFMVALRLARPDDAEVAADPVVAATWRAIADRPPRDGEHALVTRFIHPAAQQRPAAVNALIRLRIAEQWIRADRMAWSLSVLAEDHPYAAAMTATDHARIGPPVVLAGRKYHLFGHDWRATPLEAWVTLLSDRALFGAERDRAAATGFTVLNRAEFDAAVRDALRTWNHPASFATNPLLGARMIGERAGDDPQAAAELLRELIVDVVDALRDDPRESKLHRALATTYFHGTPTQEAAAERLGLPFSTYRRHLTRGIERVCDQLWEREI
jgi:DNA-directed RNA polymerase specialized sigma24 family protein